LPGALERQVSQEKPWIKLVLELKEDLVKEHKHLLRMGFYALNKHLLKEKTWHILKHIYHLGQLKNFGLWKPQMYY
jgi:hypothetical protein